MTNDAQSQPVLIKRLNREPLFDSLPIDITEKRQDLTIGCTLDGYTQSQGTVCERKPMDSVHGSIANTCFAMNGSGKLNGAGLARAAENVARWKIYLPEECVRAMMNAGWHWST